MADFLQKQERLSTLGSWALAIATAFIVLMVAGVVPRLSW